MANYKEFFRIFFKYFSWSGDNDSPGSPEITKMVNIRKHTYPYTYPYMYQGININVRYGPK